MVPNPIQTAQRRATSLEDLHVPVGREAQGVPKAHRGLHTQLTCTWVPNELEGR